MPHFTITNLLADVRFKNQGLETIEVQDNGSGITRDNYPSLALKHYTSKLAVYDDLSNLQTFGFRGEALSSLSALSHLSIITCIADDAPKGSKLHFSSSGTLESTSVVSAKQGTTVTVEDLFYNLPVRRRELERHIKREWTKVISLLNQYACILTNVKFTVSQQPTKGKRIILFSTKGNPTTRENVLNIFGTKTMAALVPLNLDLELEPTAPRISSQHAQLKPQKNRVVVKGHVSRPAHGEGRQAPDRQMFFVNGRPCGLPQFAKVFNEVYKAFNSSQSPFIFADIQLDTHLYDVNVSPDKRTILLHEQSRMLDHLKESLNAVFESHDYTVPASQLASRGLTSAKKTGVTPSIPKTPPVPGQPIPALVKLNTSMTRMATKHGGEPRQEISFPSIGAKGGGTLSSLSGASDQVLDLRDEDEHVRTETETRSSYTILPLSPAKFETGGQEPSPTTPTGSVRSHSPSCKGNGGEPETSPLHVAKVLSTSHQEAPIRQLAITNDKNRSTVAYTSPTIHKSSKRQGCGPDELTLPAFREKATRSKVAIALDRDRELQIEGPVNLELFSNRTAPVGGATRGSKEDPTVQGGVEPEDGIDFDEEEAEGSALGPETLHISANGGRDASGVVAGCHASLVTQLGPINPTLANRAPHPATGKISARRKEATLRYEQNVRLDIETLRSRVPHPAQTQDVQSPAVSLSNDDASAEIQDAERKLSLAISKGDFNRMKIIGQFNLGFILVSRPASQHDGPVARHTPQRRDELFIVDQHASDEKYNFERLQASTVVDSQRLVNPKPLELTALEEEVLLDNLPVFEANGFKVAVDTSGDSPVGARCQLLALPLSKETVFTVADLEELISLLADSPSISESRSMVRPSKVRKMFAMRACRTSVMVGNPLQHRRMERLVRRMGELDKPWNCPHGRPTMRHLCSLDSWDGNKWAADGSRGNSGLKRSWASYCHENE